MIAPGSLSAFSVATARVGPAAPAGVPQVQVARVRQAPGAGPATTTQQIEARPPVHPGHVVPRGSLVDLKV